MISGLFIGIAIMRPRDGASDNPLQEEIAAPIEQASVTALPPTSSNETYLVPTDGGSDSATEASGMAPGFSLLDLTGIEHQLSDHTGQVVLLNFWTSWCPPCREEMPALQSAYEKYYEQGFAILGINLFELDNKGAIDSFVAEFGITFPILLDVDSEVHRRLYRVIGIPTSVFINRSGIIAEVIVGPIPLDELDRRVGDLITP
jgi:thiol-disulfide isomerase/thioredoxin